MGRNTPKQAELDPVNWAAIEPLYCAGIRSVRSIGKQYGVSHTGIAKHALEFGWVRSLKPQIQARAEQLVASSAVRDRVANSVATKPSAVEKLTVEANAMALTMVQLGHRDDIARARRVAVTLLAELEAVVDRPDLFGMVYDALSNPDEPAIEALRSMATLVASLPGRVKIMKDLADTLHKVIGMEREAFGLDTSAGTDGRPMVIIKDFTGRGDRDSPMLVEEIT